MLRVEVLSTLVRKEGMKAEGEKAEAEARRRALAISFITTLILCLVS
jgi:hypothetical protein